MLAKVGSGASARAHGASRGDRSRRRLPLLGAGELRHRRRLERRRRHRPDHHLTASGRRSVVRPRRYAELVAASADARRRLASPSGSARSRSSRSRRYAVHSYETRGRIRPGGRVRRCARPFQRDRDRIVHSKPFRRLKGKTQVFIDPAGDHYRTRMTHTLETTAIARVVARALAAQRGSRRGDRPRPRHRPHALRPRRRAGARPGPERPRRRALRPQRAVAADRRAAQPHRGGARRHPHPHRRPGARDARGQGRADRRSRRLHQPRHRRRDPVRHPRGGRPARTRRSSCSAPPASRRIDTLVHDLVECSARAGDIVQSEEIGGALAVAARLHVRARLPRAGDQERPAPGAGDDRGDLRRAARARRRARSEIIDFVSGMTDRFALDYAGRSRSGADQEAGVERIRAECRLGRGRRGAHVAAPSGRHASSGAARSTRSGRRASRSTRSTSSSTASAATRAATSSSSSARPRDSTSSARSSGSATASGSPLEYEESSPPRRRLGAAADSGSRRCSRTRRASTSATCGSRRRAPSRATTSPGRGLGEAVCREFRLGLALGGGTLDAQGAREGLHARGAAGRGPGARTRRRLLRAPTRLPARRRPRPSARASRRGRLFEDDPLAGKYVNTPGVGALLEARRRLRSRQGARGDRERGPRLRRRREHRRDRAPPGRLPAGRRLHGHGADRGAAARSSAG